MKKLITLPAIIYCLLQTAFAQPGQLDPTFGDHGIVKTTLGVPGTTSFNFIAVRNDGKIQVSGTASNNGSAAPALARYDKNGALDSSFFPMDDPQQQTNAIAMQNDGKLLFAGTTPGDFAVARYNNNGKLDSSFAGTGVQSTDFTGENDVANAVTIQSDGKIVAAGFDNVSDPSEDNSFGSFALVRYNSNGTPDSTFGNIDDVRDGRTTFSLNSDHSTETFQYFTAVASQNDGKTVAAGDLVFEFKPENPGSGEPVFVVSSLYILRFQNNGEFDPTFPGTALTSHSGPITDGWPSVKTLLVQNDGKIVALLDVPHVFQLFRINSDDTFDSTFGENGILTTSFDSTVTVTPVSMVIQPDGKLIVGGYLQGPDGNNDFVLIRYNTNGSLDSSFGVNGKQITDAGGSETLSSMTIANNRLYVAGTEFNSSGGVGIVASYLLDNQQQQQTVSCPASKIVSTAKGRCDTIVNDIDPVVSTAAAVVKYTLTGATVGSGTGSVSGKVFNKGITNVRYALAADTSKNCSFTITVNDKEAPEITRIFAFPNILFPANNTMRNVFLFYNSKDNCGGTDCKISVTANQDIIGDWQIVNDHLIKLRAQHSRRKTRVYTVTVTCTDASGNSADRKVNIWVPAGFGGRDMYVAKDDDSDPIFEKSFNGFGVKAYPNPTSDQFNLQLISDNNCDKINLRIYDMSGRIMEVRTGLVAGEAIQAGASLKTGIYIAEVQQGMNVQRLKLIKIK
jgi:uncharacterized delta-60 repeat protein